MMVDAPAAPPLAISAPSSASDRDLHNKVDTLPLIHKFVLHTSGEGTLAGRLLLDVVVGQRAAVLQLLAGEDQALLIRGDASFPLHDVQDVPD
jgi:hypothetical protein